MQVSEFMHVEPHVKDGAVEERVVLVRTDRPGERATSATTNAADLIRAVADAAGLSVTIDGLA